MTGRSVVWKALGASLLMHVLLLLSPVGQQRQLSYTRGLQVTLPAISISPGKFSDPASGVQDVSSTENVRDIVELNAVVPKVESRPGRKSPAVFFSGAELSRKPVLLNPEWLDAAWALPPQAFGELVLRISIDQNGKIVAIDSESGPSELAEWLRDTMPAKAKFSPAERDGRPVNSVIRVRLNLGAVTH